MQWSPTPDGLGDLLLSSDWSCEGIVVQPDESTPSVWALGTFVFEDTPARVPGMDTVTVFAWMVARGFDPAAVEAGLAA